MFDFIFGFTFDLEHLLKNELHRITKIKKIIISFGSIFGFNFDSISKSLETKYGKEADTKNEQIGFSEIFNKIKKLKELITKTKDSRKTQNDRHENNLKNQRKAKCKNRTQKLKYFQMYEDIEQDVLKKLQKYNNNLKIFFLNISQTEKKVSGWFQNLQNQLAFRKFIKKNFEQKLSKLILIPNFLKYLDNKQNFLPKV